MNILKRLKDLEKNAAPAPWHPINIYGDIGINNADFIAEMRNSLPALLRVIEALYRSGMMAPSVRAALDAFELRDRKTPDHDPEAGITKPFNWDWRASNK